jgi:hypothetical protein
MKSGQRESLEPLSVSVRFRRLGDAAPYAFI